MLVSREVDCEKLIDFSVEERFLKMPIDKYLQVSGVEPIAPQIGMVNAINDPKYRFVTAVLSRRTGKTFMGNIIAFMKLLEPGSQVLIIAPNYSLANISWLEQLKMVKSHNLKMERCNAKDKELVLENGSLLKLASVGNADSAVGRSYDLVLFDEAAIDDRGGDAFNVVLMPTLDKPNSKAIFISTPRGSNWMKEFYDHGFDDAMGNWCSLFGTYKDNPRVSEDVIESARRTMSKAQFAQEFECSFVTREGVIYEDFDFDEHTFIMEDSEIDFDDPNHFESIMGIDPGYKDPTAVCVIKYDFENDIFYIIDEYQRAMASTAVHAQTIVELTDRHEIDMCFIDSAAAQFAADLVYEFDISSSPAKKSVLDGIAYVQMLVQTGRLRVASHCDHTKEMFINYRWKMDGTAQSVKERPLHDQYSHMADAIRYALYSYDRL
tara:strand:- start:2241 stop:3548 length:1308 start_codon:yes stop_codon:yes gene_type:complete